MKTYYLKNKTLIYDGRAVYSIPSDWDLELKRFLNDDQTWKEQFGKSPRNKDCNADFFFIPKDQRIGQLCSFKEEERLNLRKIEWKFEFLKTYDVVREIVRNKIDRYELRLHPKFKK